MSNEKQIMIDILNTKIFMLNYKLDMLKKYILNERDTLLSILERKHSDSLYKHYFFCQMLIELINDNDKYISYKARLQNDQRNH